MSKKPNPFADLNQDDDNERPSRSPARRGRQDDNGSNFLWGILAGVAVLFLVVGLLFAVAVLWGGRGTKGKEPVGTVELAQTRAGTKEATIPPLGGGERPKHQVSDKDDQQKLDAVNIEWFNHHLAVFKRAGQPGYRESREDSRTAYGIMIRQEAILKNHPDWPMLGLTPSPAVERLFTELKQVTFAPWDHLEKPGLVQTADQFKIKYIDGQAPDPVDQRLLDGVNKRWFRLGFLFWNTLKSTPGWEAPRALHQEMYEVLRQRDEILKRHPWWSALGPDYSPEIHQLFEEWVQKTNSFLELNSPGKYRDMAPSYKARNLDGNK